MDIMIFTVTHCISAKCVESDFLQKTIVEQIFKTETYIIFMRLLELCLLSCGHMDWCNRAMYGELVQIYRHECARHEKSKTDPFSNNFMGQQWV